MEIATMHDMSNTRKEIAARLGFAAKEVFADKRTTAGALRKALKAKGITSAADLEWHGISASDSDSTPYWLYEDGSMEKIDDVPHGQRDTFIPAPKKKSSRPGAKAQFDNKQIAQGLSRLLKETGFDGMASDVLSGPSDSETLRKYVRVLKGKMSPLSGDAKSAELLSKLDKMLSSRPGAKDEFAAHPSWSEGILGKDTDPKLAAYSWISKNNIETGRKQMLLADLAAGMYEKNPSMSIAQAVLAAAKDMVSKGVATRDIQQWAENGGKFARPGAKTRMTREQTEEQKAGLKIMSAADPAVGAKIAKLIKEGKPQDQAVAIALDMKRRGEL
jgi:hypothetical protein